MKPSNLSIYLSRSHHPTVAISYYLIHGSAGGDKINNTSTTPSQRGQLAGKYFWRAPLFSLPPACTIVRAVPHRDIDAYGLLERNHGTGGSSLDRKCRMRTNRPWKDHEHTRRVLQASARLAQLRMVAPSMHHLARTKRPSVLLPNLPWLSPPAPAATARPRV